MDCFHDSLADVDCHTVVVGVHGVLVGHSLHIKALDSPQTVSHHVCAIESLSLPLISGFVASISRRPFRSLPIKEFSGLVIQQTVSSPQNLGLLGVGILGGMLGRLMKLPPGTVTELAGLSTVAVKGVCLRLVRKVCLQEDVSFAPNTVCPLKDFDVFRQCIPSFQEGFKTLMNDFDAPASGPFRDIFSAKLGSGRLLLVKYRNHANHNPAPRFRAHIVMNTAQRHCHNECVSVHSILSYIYLHDTG